MKHELLACLVLCSSLFSGCLDSNDNTASELEESQQIIEEMELKISNLSSQLDGVNNTILELQVLQSQLNEISSQLDEANNTILELQYLLTISNESAEGMYWPMRFESYNSTGFYMNHANWNNNLWERVIFDDYGVPLVNYSWGFEYVPTTAFHWGLVSYSKWVETGNTSNWDDAVKIAEWAVQNQSEDGAWLWGFSHNYSRGVLGELSSGWPGGMTQGLGMSFLVRMYSVTNDTRYLNAALNATQPLQETVEDGGVVRMFNDQWIWYEEYPTPDNGSYVLNGFIYTLIGLYDNWLILSSNVSGELYGKGIESLQHMISMFDLGCNSSYDLVHHSIGGSAPNIARTGYHNLHISLLSVINVIEGDLLVDVEDRWLDYAMGQCFASPNGAN
ncbi:MAG TPA: hypothetical protein EYQ53_02030 [Candidatus Poseidoniales archaeon]|nr:hypothetical protein [Candidatus Poseidoniales archaeon]